MAMTPLSLDEAQRSLSSLAERALRGEQVLIQVEGASELLSLQTVASELPPDYLRACYGPEEIRQEEHLAGFAPQGM